MSNISQIHKDSFYLAIWVLPNFLGYMLGMLYSLKPDAAPIPPMSRWVVAWTVSAEHVTCLLWDGILECSPSESAMGMATSLTVAVTDSLVDIDRLCVPFVLPYLRWSVSMANGSTTGLSAGLESGFGLLWMSQVSANLWSCLLASS